MMGPFLLIKFNADLPKEAKFPLSLSGSSPSLALRRERLSSISFIRRSKSSGGVPLEKRNSSPSAILSEVGSYSIQPYPGNHTSTQACAMSALTG